MVNASSATALTSILPYAGPLFGVVIGAGLTWLLQQNEWRRQRRWELKRDADGIPLDKSEKQQLAKWHNAVILSARQALGIKRAGGLPVLDYDNESPITDH